jgi:hypothetical protein
LLPLNNPFRGLKQVYASSEAILPPVTDGLRGWYKFNEGSGQSVTDYSGNGNHGQLGTTAGADTNDPTWVTSGLQFITDDITQFQHQEFEQFTYIIAIELNAIDPESTPGLMGQMTDGYLGELMYLDHSRGAAAYAGNDIWPQLTDSKSFNTGEIYVFAATYDGTDLVGYYNGREESRNALTPQDIFVTGTGDFCIGGALSPGSTLLGQDNHIVSYAMVYNTALTGQEIADTYAFIQSELSQRGLFSLPQMDNLKIWAKFNEGSGQILTDYSGNNNYGQLGLDTVVDTNDPTWEDGSLRFIVDDFVMCSHQEFANFTYVVAVKYNPSDEYIVIMGEGDSNGNGPYIYAVIEDGLVFLCWASNPTFYLASFPLEEIKDVPKIITVTYDGTNFKWYLNDILWANVLKTPAEIISAPITDTGNFYWGGILDVWIDGDQNIYYGLLYDVALTDQEVVEAYSYIQAELAAREVIL